MSFQESKAAHLNPVAGPVQIFEPFEASVQRISFRSVKLGRALQMVWISSLVVSTANKSSFCRAVAFIGSCGVRISHASSKCNSVRAEPLQRQ